MDDPISATWDVRGFRFGLSHMTHVSQVLSQWPGRNQISKVVIADFAMDPPESLQACFLRPFGLIDVAGVVTSSATDAPKLVLSDTVLPADSLPAEKFPLAELLAKKTLWIAALSTRELNFEVGPHHNGDVTAPLRLGGHQYAISILASSIFRSRVLTRLSLPNHGLGEVEAAELEEGIAACSTLRFMDLSNNALGPAGAQIVMRAIQRNGNVTALDLSRNAIGDDGARRIAKPLAASSSLVDLSLRMNDIGDDGCFALTEALLMNAAIERLQLAHNRIPPEALAAVLRATMATCCLKYLDFEHNAPWPCFEGNEAAIMQVVDSFNDRNAVREPSIVTLSLRNCCIRGNCAAMLLSALSHNRTLRVLNMSWNYLRQVGCVELATWLASPECVLRELDLRDNQLGLHDSFPLALSHAFTAIAPTKHGEHTGERVLIASNASLRRLNLATNDLSDVGIRHLSSALQNFMGLRELLLYHNPEVGSGGIQALLPILVPPNNGAIATSVLTSLNVATCNVGDAGCRTLAGALEKCASLTKLDLSNNSIFDIQPIADALATNDTLRELNLSLNAICLFSRRMVICGVSLNSASAIKCIDLSAQNSTLDSLLGADVIKASKAKAAMKGLARVTRVQEFALKFDVDVSLAEFTRGVGPDVVSKFLGVEY